MEMQMRGDIEWGKYFSKKEFQCSTTGDCKMEQDFIDKMNQLREMFGKPIVITSGYRSALHPAEAKKATPGVHNEGVAADVAVSREDAYKLLLIAFQIGFTGIGVQQKGVGRFIHLDTSTGSSRSPRPTVWSY